jgi:hypothetical protein
MNLKAIIGQCPKASAVPRFVVLILGQVAELRGAGHAKDAGSSLKQRGFSRRFYLKLSAKQGRMRLTFRFAIRGSSDDKASLLVGLPSASYNDSSLPRSVLIMTHDLDPGSPALGAAPKRKKATSPWCCLKGRHYLPALGRPNHATD